MYGRLVGRRRQGYTIVAVMAVLWLAPMVVAGVVEGNGNPRADAVTVNRDATAEQPGGNMEGKEARFGPVASAHITIGTMGTSAGITNSALDSYVPVGGASALGPILLGEISPGGVGSGLYGILVYILLAVFIGGLLVGRTPEYLGKKVLGTEVKLVALYVLVLPVVILAGAAASVLLSTATASALNPGAHGFTEIFYAFASAANGNGSALPDSTRTPTGTTRPSAWSCSRAASCQWSWRSPSQDRWPRAGCSHGPTRRCRPRAPPLPCSY